VRFDWNLLSFCVQHTKQRLIPNRSPYGHA
jgi:hypothetical protein